MNKGEQRRGGRWAGHYDRAELKEEAFWFGLVMTMIIAGVGAVLWLAAWGLYLAWQSGWSWAVVGVTLWLASWVFLSVWYYRVGGV